MLWSSASAGSIEAGWKPREYATAAARKKRQPGMIPAASLMIEEMIVRDYL
jgi:hypothetical protein